ncbi:hypothetical protein [Asticcacaulis sp.]|uniref:hypothetical protein n=1 Tax=Asticcacaulis sp. TaxID=1872648 RepID=UPI003F7C82E1
MKSGPLSWPEILYKREKKTERGQINKGLIREFGIAGKPLPDTQKEGGAVRGAAPPFSRPVGGYGIPASKAEIAL